MKILLPYIDQNGFTITEDDPRYPTTEKAQSYFMNLLLRGKGRKITHEQACDMVKMLHGIKLEKTWCTGTRTHITSCRDSHEAFLYDSKVLNPACVY